MEAILDMNILVPAALFAALAPGMIVNVDVSKPTDAMISMVRTADWKIVATHAAVFAVSYAGLRYMFPQYY
jgi:hypothetical protein